MKRIVITLTRLVIASVEEIVESSTHNVGIGYKPYIL